MAKPSWDWQDINAFGFAAGVFVFFGILAGAVGLLYALQFTRLPEFIFQTKSQSFSSWSITRGQFVSELFFALAVYLALITAGRVSLWYRPRRREGLHRDMPSWALYVGLALAVAIPVLLLTIG